MNKADSNGLTTSTYDAAGQVTAVNAPAGLLNYAHYPVGNRLAMMDRDGGATRYSYDDLNRLTTLTNADREITSVT